MLIVAGRDGLRNDDARIISDRESRERQERHAILVVASGLVSVTLIRDDR
jgi:hypothetical protein